MDIILVVSGLVLLGVLVGITLLIVSKKHTKHVKSYDASSMIQILDKNNIKEITFIRNKIAIEFLNIDFFNPEELQECGAKGISIVGDKIKFYIDGTNEENQALFLELKQYIEG